MAEGHGANRCFVDIMGDHMVATLWIDARKSNITRHILVKKHTPHKTHREIPLKSFVTSFYYNPSCYLSHVVTFVNHLEERLLPRGMHILKMVSTLCDDSQANSNVDK